MSVDSICFLQKLPAELRLLIYQFLVFNEFEDIEQDDFEKPGSLWGLKPPVIKYGRGSRHRLWPGSAKTKKFVLARASRMLYCDGLSLLRCNRFFFSDLCPLLYKNVLFMADCDHIPLLELASESSKSQRWPKSQTENHTSCSPSHACALQNINQVLIQHPASFKVDTRLKDAHYLTNMLLLLGRSLVQLSSLLPNLKTMYVKFPWQRVDMVALPLRRSFFMSCSSLVSICPKLQSLHFWDCDTGYLRQVTFLSLNKEWHSVRENQRAKNGQVDELKMKEDTAFRQRELACLMTEVFNLKPWSTKSSKETIKKFKKLDQIKRESKFVVDVDYFIDLWI